MAHSPWFVTNEVFVDGDTEEVQREELELGSHASLYCVVFSHCTIVCVCVCVCAHVCVCVYRWIHYDKEPERYIPIFIAIHGKSDLYLHNPYSYNGL